MPPITSVLIVKIILMSFVAVALLCVIPCVPVGLKAISDLELHSTSEKSMTSEEASSAKIILVTMMVLEFVTLILVFVAAVKDNFCLSCITATALFAWSLGYMFLLRTSLDIIVLVLNVLVSVVAMIFAILVKTFPRPPRQHSADEWELS